MDKNLETMLAEATPDAEQLAKRAYEATLASVTQNNKLKQKYIQRLQELYEEIVKCEDEGELESLEDEAADLAESLDIEFVYVRKEDGAERRYTPQSMWEASGDCSWEQSAEYGYDYGWDVR